MSVNPRSSTLRRSTVALAALAGLLASLSAAAVDWSGVPASNLVLTYPGQASWEWVLTKTDHEGAEKFRGGKDCRSCHGDEAMAEGGAEVAAGGPLEPAPIAGKPGSLPVKVQVAHDGARLYFRLQWKETGVTGNTMDPKFAAHASIFLADISYKEAARAGCWAACHDDVHGMASAGSGGQEKYIGATRAKLSRQGGGSGLKPAGDIAALLTAGSYFEYLTAGLNPGQPAVAQNGYILDERHEASPVTATADATFAGGEWTVVLSRPLASAGAGQHALAEGKQYAIGVAIHDGHTNGRFHYVSIEQTLAIGSGAGDLVATKR